MLPSLVTFPRSLSEIQLWEVGQIPKTGDSWWQLVTTGDSWWQLVTTDDNWWQLVAASWSSAVTSCHQMEKLIFVILIPPNATIISNISPKFGRKSTVWSRSDPENWWQLVTTGDNWWQLVTAVTSCHQLSPVFGIWSTSQSWISLKLRGNVTNDGSIR